MNNIFLLLATILLFSCNYNDQNININQEENDSIAIQQDLNPKKEITKQKVTIWKESKISWFYKLDEKNSFTKGCENEKEWLDDKITSLLKTGLSSGVDSKNSMQWNPANDLYFFVAIPVRKQNEIIKYLDYENSIEIWINDISMPFTLYHEIDTDFGILLYYKLPIWFWNLEMISTELSDEVKKEIFGENYLKDGPNFASEGTLYGFTTKVERTYKLFDSEDENKIIKSENKLLIKHHFICAFGE